MTAHEKRLMPASTSLSKSKPFKAIDIQNTRKLGGAVKSKVIALAIAGRLSYSTATKLINWLGVRHA